MQHFKGAAPSEVRVFPDKGYGESHCRAAHRAAQRQGRRQLDPKRGGGGGAGAGPGPRCCADVPPRRFVNSAGFVNYGQHDECAVSIVKVRPA